MENSLREGRFVFSIPQLAWKMAGWLAWVLPLLVISFIVIHNPARGSVTPVYHDEVDLWFHRQPLQLFYFPQFVLLFAPFHLLPSPLGDVAWRWMATAGLGFGLYYLLRNSFPNSNWRAFALVSLASMPLMLGSIRNGQANAQLAAALVLAAVCMLRQRWWWGTLFLMIAIITKPLGLAAAGLAFVVFPQMRWRLPAGIFLLFALPFLFGPPSYVAGQLAASVQKLKQCEVLSEWRYSGQAHSLADQEATLSAVAEAAALSPKSDISGLLIHLGIPFAGFPATLTRIAAGLMVAGVCWLIAASRDKLQSVSIWFTASPVWLMLFNPMTETNSYVILAPVFGWWIWYFVENKKVRLACGLAMLCLSMPVLRNVIEACVGSQYANAFADAFFPAVTIILTVVASREFYLQFSNKDEIKLGIGS